MGKKPDHSPAKATGQSTNHAERQTVVQREEEEEEERESSNCKKEELVANCVQQQR